jgi:DNA-binding GntR family transcriptional regulator
LTLTRTALREQVREILLEKILSGELQPGDRLVELQLAKEFGTSQAPVREALGELKTLGFVEHESYRGTRVRKMTEERLAEIYPVRAALEELAVREAAVGMDGEVSELREEFEGMRRAAEADDPQTLSRHDASFHRIIVEAAGNGVLLDTWRTLGVQARTYVTMLKAEADLVEIADLHRPLLEALADRSPEAAAAALRWHFDELQRMTRERRQTG